MQAKILAAVFTALYVTVSVLVLPVNASPTTGEVQKPRIETDSKEIKNSHDRSGGYRQRWVEFEKDPLKILEGRKEKVRSLLNEGKISKEKADEIGKRIDDKINEVNEFSKLTLTKKKEQLNMKLNEKLEQGVKSGRLPSDKADELKKQFDAKLKSWDGIGYPRFLLKPVK